MKSILLILLTAFFQQAYSQDIKDQNESITSKLQLTIKQNIEKEVPAFKQRMLKYKPEH